MKAYRTSVKIKLGLIVAAVAIAVASLAYTNALADRLQAREQEAVRLWARAIEYQAQAVLGNPYYETFEALSRAVESGDVPVAEADSFEAALEWARSMPPSGELDFVFNQIVEPARFNVPAVITDTAITMVTSARHVDVDSTAGEAEITLQLLARARAFDEVNEPIRFAYYGGQVQLVHYGESDLSRVLRWFPFVQLGFVALFIFVGYLGFSYVRRNEQSSLWVGMAKEAAHQLGTPISSMIGWIELLRLQREDDPVVGEVTDELERDVDRLRLVADRFSKIGSRPELSPTDLAAVIEHVAGYIRRRIPESRHIRFDVQVPGGLVVRLNAELFEWVVENLLKNALDAIEGDGRISITARREGSGVVVEVRDTGKGMDRATARHIFRPGFSTKKRGWGLGLSLAKRIVEDYHGGTLALKETRPGGGTTFCITLRAAEHPAPPRPPLRALSEAH
ncbi:MAG TPA: HAMP domain-containing sensor histidine kinase [Rubricoccaceae bacterium]|nr:HAMP domain-containing sensor histidine kinase [Rubricoccaceae bacterium]